MKLGKTIKKVPWSPASATASSATACSRSTCQQSLFLLDEGALAAAGGRALQKWGMAMGPFAMGDMAGQDIGWEIRKRRARGTTRTSCTRGSADRICEQGRFGQKTGKGWYRYEAGNRKPIPDPEVEKLIADYRKENGVQRRARSPTRRSSSAACTRS